MDFFFSIVIPTFNREEGLRRCLNSLTLQTFKDFEVIVCDDGSTDETLKVVGSYQEILQLKYSFEKNWGGPAAPRNRGINLAKGKWVCFLDSDDCYTEDTLAFLSNTITDRYDIYHYRLISINNKGEKGLPFCRQINNENPAIDLLTNFSGILTSATCVLRESILVNNLYFSENREIIGVEDFDFWIQAGFKGLKFKFLDKKLGFYFSEGEDSISYKDERQAKRLEVMYQNHQHLLSKFYRKKSMAALDYQKACIFLDSDRQKGIKLFWSAFNNGTIYVKMRCIFRIIRLYI
ncbi:MAG TPA: glycosyltransferase family 2 protein [Pelobium sp.]|nr:glycosyltransferase family 2 protein [Pelobium sp.]